ncbi:MAG: hypothetical protein RLZZ546_1782 [Bacteroidota bacterium]|jgi:uncharacterized damage-inducible protein DinB|nr:DinB family protein [Chitinophagaceae bacterium]
MKTFLSILLLSYSFTGIAQSNQLLINSHLEKFKNAKSYTLSMAEKLDEQKYDFKPVKEEMSFKEQLVHIGENIYWLSSTYIKEEPNPLKGKKVNSSDMNKEQVMQFVKDAYEYGLKVMIELDEKTLSNEFNWNAGKLNKYQFLNLIQDHQAHHVGQIIVYLRLNTIEPPKYIGW